MFLFTTGLSFKSKFTRLDDASSQDEAGSLCFTAVDDIGAVVVVGWTVEEVPKSLNGFATAVLDVEPLLGNDMLVKSPLPPKGSLEGAPEILNPPEDANGSFVVEILVLKGSDVEAETGRPLFRVDDGDAVPKDIDAK